MTELTTTDDKPALEQDADLGDLWPLCERASWSASPAIVAIILNYVKRGDVAGTYLESHFTWQIRTFWISLDRRHRSAVVLMFVLIGCLVLLADAVWVIYRLVIGALKLNENKPVVEGKFGLAA